MQEEIIAPYRIDPAWLIAATSFLVDRVVPDCERIRLPAREVPGGIMRYGRGPLPPPPAEGGRLASLRNLRATPPVPAPHGDVFDLRRNTPSNWAHFLNNHLPLVLTICDRMQIDPRKALLVLPKDTPGYILRAAEMLALDILTTDAPISGEGVAFDVAPWSGLRPLRHTWVRTALVETMLSELEAARMDLPRKVFLSRRNTRAPVNEDAVMDWLRPRGFVKVYPEDLSPGEQIALFRQAEQMVAVHGAGLAPLLYAQPGGRLQHLVEVLHAGHMTDVYRVMCQQIGVSWIGVRGALKPAYIRDAYDFDTLYTAHSFDNFRIDLTALETAFEMAGLT